jgi:hypothetical protein
MLFQQTVFVLLFSLCIQVGFAKQDSLQQNYTLPKATLKINPSCLLNPWRSALHFSSDIRVHQNVSIEPGIGWFMGRWQKLNDYQMNGLRARLGVKYHWLAEDDLFPYLGIEVKYNFIAERGNKEVCRYGCQYTEIMNLKEYAHTGGVAIKAGALFFLDKKKQVVFDLYGGIGYKFTRKTRQDLPEDAEILSFNNRSMITIDLPQGNHHLPDFLFGFSLGYSFW